MREWAATHIGLVSVLAGLAGGILAVAVDVLLGQRLDRAVINSVFFMLFFGGSAFFGQKRLRKTKARLDETGQSLMFLRYPNSLPGSLSGVWQMGVATPGPGRIDFQPAAYEDLIPVGRSRTLTGVHATQSLPRKADRRDNKQAVPYGFKVITLDSDCGTIEIAASPYTLQKIRETVEPASP